MREATGRRTAPALLFAFLSSGIFAAAFTVAGRLPHLAAGAGTVALALTIDLVVVVPLAFYLCVVRPRGLPLVTMAPVYVLSTVLASLVLPADSRQALRVAELLAVPMEIGLVGWIAWRTSRAIRTARRDGDADLLEQLRRAAFDVTRNDRVAAIFATEIGVLCYSLGSWRARAHVPEGTSGFTHHRKSAHGAIAFAFVLVMSVEALAVHMLLRSWSELAAWIVTLGTAYGALWLIADYRATVLRPILIDRAGVLVRAGLRCTLQVPLDRIAAVARSKPELGKESVNLTFLGTPTHWLVLSEPMIAEGAYGFRRRVRALGIQPDEPDEFERALGEE